MFKNPKQKGGDHGGSLMQPKHESQLLFEAPPSAALLAKKEADVSPNDMFYYQCVLLAAFGTWKWKMRSGRWK